MSDPDLSASLDAAWGDPASWVANGLQWTHLDEVQRMINRRVSDEASVDPLEWFANHLGATGQLPLRRALVLGCGTGQVERTLHEQGWAREIVAFDLSPKVLDVARQAAAGMESIRYVLASMDALPVGEPPFEAGSFDAVLGVSSVHHCSRLADLYAAVDRLLVPGGWFFLDEYIGPDRFQFSREHMRQAEALAQLLPRRLVTTSSGAIKQGFRAPTVEEVVAIDPSEAVCSSRIVDLLQERFRIERHRPYGGALLHILLADIAQNFAADAAKPYLGALIEAEEELLRLGTIEHHFACIIARSQDPGSRATGA